MNITIKNASISTALVQNDKPVMDKANCGYIKFYSNDHYLSPISNLTHTGMLTCSTSHHRKTAEGPQM